MALIAQWLGCQPQEAEVLGSILTTSYWADVSPFKVSGGSPVHLRSKHQATGSRTWMEDPLGQKQKRHIIYNIISYDMI